MKNRDRLTDEEPDQPKELEQRIAEAFEQADAEEARIADSLGAHPRRVPNRPTRAPDTLSEDQALADHFWGDACDLTDDHERFHHEGGHHCSHPDCRSDAIFDESRTR